MDKRFTDSYIEELAHKFKTGTLTPEEQADFKAWYQNHKDTEFAHSGAHDPGQVKERMLAGILSETHPMQTRKFRPLWPRIAVAASILLCCSVGLYVYQQHQKPAGTQIAKQDIAPGHNQATLTLANGQKIVLTKGLSGQLATQGNMQIKVNAGNAIAYIPQSTTTTNQPVYNTLSTVRGQESPYPLVLSDGTKVWLNAESSITYPIAFNGKVRSVKITGEAYFEVVHNAAQPFKVEVKGQTIEDIGTAFNINAYNDEPDMKTTLISGSVRINGKTVLHPGEQAVQSGPDIKVKEVDTEGAIAWKNGYFLFDKENLESTMRRVSRWYNVDVEYEEGTKGYNGFLGSMTRYSNVSDVLSALEAAGKVKFKIEGRKIIVSKK
ncbi:DUF4974 domain-containing protein [Mucilaginibacter sp. BJC16-A38]|uniref:FecR family protein n=1 Tax=Mucilaginibacter phenanthrenivorans TaxID=1234842 RepID=UPI002157ADEB|nr:FecR family protein [Mucilaginibacter phenanthrenivorans]MCR8556965.1 DUF4974 domain-containing protein [Mucilaginibacter phenanthrenivorans]